jgi:hypothetical protein
MNSMNNREKKESPMTDKITMTREQFDKLVNFLEEADSHTRLAFQGNDLDCFTTCHLNEACNFRERRKKWRPIMTDIPEKKEEKAGQKRGYSINLDEPAEKWPSPFVARNRFEEFSGGLFKSGSMSTFDARGNGINTRYRRGTKIFYEVTDAIAWLKTRTKKEGGK